MAENASQCNASTMQKDVATGDSTSTEEVAKGEDDIKTTKEAVSSLPKKENEVPRSKRAKYNLKECSVVLEPLSEEMILKYTTAPFPPSKQHSLRPLPNSKKLRFNRFKKQRGKFLKKRSKKRRHSEDSHSDSLTPDQAEENNKRRKKLGYEEDVDWSPPEDCNPVLPKQTKKSKLRLNPRRKRIESVSSDESESEQKVYETRRSRTDPSKRAFLGESSGDESFLNFFDEDEIKNKNKESELINKKTEKEISSHKCSNDAKVAFVKEESDSSTEDPVSQLMTDIVDTVATMLDRPESIPKCRWCDSEISDPLSILCPICKDMGHDETIKPKKQRAKPKKNPPAKKAKGKTNNSFRSKLTKMLPKQEMQKFLYSNVKAREQKQFNHCRIKKTPKRQNLDESLKSDTLEEQLLKASLAADAKQKAVDVPKKASHTGVKKSLIAVDKSQLVAVSEPEATKTGQVSNVQHGTYLLPSVPSVVVANYATSDAEKGDYFLSSLYYKNESTPSKAAATSAGPNTQAAAGSAAIAIKSGSAKKTVSASLVSAAPKSNLPGLTAREVVQNRLQGKPISKAPPVNLPPSLPFLSNSSISLVPIAPKPPSTASHQQTRMPNSLSMPSLSALIDPATSALVPSSSILKPSHTLLQAALTGANSQLQICALPASSPSVMQPASSNVPSNSAVVTSRDLQLIPVSKPSLSVIAKTEPQDAFEEIMQDINPGLLVNPLSDAPPLDQPNNVEQNIPLMDTELPFGSENLLSSLPFSSELSLIPAQIDELTDDNFNSLIIDQGDSSPEKGQLGNQSECSFSAQTPEQLAPMDTGQKTPEKSPSTDTQDNQNLKVHSPRKKEFSPPDITRNLIDSLKESLSLREKTLQELDAICIMCITDIEDDPKTSLLRFIESNRREQEELLQKQKSLSAPIEEGTAAKEEADKLEKKLKAVERNANVYEIAWQYLKYHSSFQKYSDALLSTSRFMNVQIKKEIFEQGEEEASSCQFANQNSAPNFQGQQISEQQAAINNILNQMQSQVNSIPGGGASYSVPGAGSSMQYHGLSPVSVAMGGDPSRETPSRGSGPRTPARPESALSQPEDLLPLVPIQDTMAMQTYPQNIGQPVNVQRVNVGQVQAVRAAGTVQPANPSQFNNSIPQVFQRMLVSMGNRPSLHAQVRSSGGKVYNVMRVEAPRMIRPAYTVQGNFVPTSSAGGNTFTAAAPNQNSYVGPAVAGPVTLQNNYGSAVVPVSLQNSYGTAPVSLQSITPGTTVVLQTGQPLQGQNLQSTELPDVSSLRCAVCYGVATLRCKQCSKVAYCNTTCAKKYWHSRHKMECLQLMNT